MENKIWLLICTTKEDGVIAVRAYTSLEEAQGEMRGQMKNEKGGYKWIISEVNNPYEADAEEKRRYVESVVYRLVEDDKLSSDTFHKLTIPLKGRTGFYLDRTNGTIMVWNTEKRNYTNILNLPLDVAYDMAKMLENADYEEEA